MNDLTSTLMPLIRLKERRGRRSLTVRSRVNDLNWLMPKTVPNLVKGEVN